MGHIIDSICKIKIKTKKLTQLGDTRTFITEIFKSTVPTNTCIPLKLVKINDENPKTRPV